MSNIPRKKSRPIVVGGRSYRWMLPSKRSPRYFEDGFTGGLLTVQAKDGGQVLQARILSRLAQEGAYEEGWPHKESLTPADVRLVIKEGLTQGWDPSAKQGGTPFKLAPPLDLADYTVRVW